MKVTVKLGKDRFQRWQKVLKRKTPLKGTDDTLDSTTVEFSDHYCVVVKLCNGGPPYVEVVLFTPKGNESKSWTSRAVALACEPLSDTIELDTKHTVIIGGET